MKCPKPFLYEGVIPFGCGQCMFCRINRQRLLQHRLMLESMDHEHSCFLTLTYADEFLPKNGSLRRRDIVLFLKALRRRIEPTKIRYYYVGEYGERSGRPHYHVALFGLGKDSHDLLHDVWGKGLIDTGHEGPTGKINKDSAQYIAGYVTKKMTNWNDPRVKAELIAQGKEPEFGQGSLKPGLGYGVVKKIVDFLTTDSGAESLIRHGDVPMVLNHGKKAWPLGRYLRQKIREQMGFYETGAQEGWEKQSKIRAEEEMLELCINQGLLGLIKKEEETPEIKLFKQMYNQQKGGWRREILRRRNEQLELNLSDKEKFDKRKGRKL